MKTAIFEECPFLVSNRKEKPMENKVIFESEEEFKVIIGLITTASDNSPAMNMYLKNAKICQMIRKSAVEEAEYIYRSLRYDETYTSDYCNEVIDKLFKAIQELKAKLKKEEK